MFAPIAEPIRPAGSDLDEPLVVLIRISWDGPRMIYNVVASCSTPGLWWVSGLERPCPWEEILVRVVPRWAQERSYAVEVVRLALPHPSRAIGSETAL